MKPRRGLRASRILVSFLCLLFLLAFSSVESDLAADRAALLALRDQVHGRPLLWNVSASPCTWRGVRCQSDRVVELRLPGMGLSGPLPLGIGNLTKLQAISLRFNALTGPIPADFASLTSLQSLYLQGNAFNGKIPDFMFNLPSLVRLSLAKNNFSGQIPSNVNNATRLATLHLQENRLTGPIPRITLQLQQFNASSNNLTGSIPDKLSGMPKSAFEGNSLCGKPLAPCPGADKENDKLSGGAIAGIVIGAVVLFLVILLILFCLCRKRKKNENAGSETVGAPATAPARPKETAADVSREKGVPETAATTRGGAVSKEGKSGMKKDLVFFIKSYGEFDLDGLLKASAEVLGKGTLGSSYKASFDHGLVVAVKRLRDVIVPEKEFRERMEFVGAMRHENLVRLIAYYYSKDEKLLVFDYMPRGSLSALLHGNKGSGRTPLNWETRATIALGAANAIAHVHSRDPSTSHGNIKSSNILLSESYEARVSDFCVAPLINSATAPNRIDGYRAPEVTDPRRVSQKADVFSFGVLLLELLTGKSPTHPQLNEEGVDLPRWVQSVMEQQSSSEVFDPELLRYGTENDSMLRLLQLAINCTAQYPDTRPSMAEVTRVIAELTQPSIQPGDSSPI